MTAPTTRYVIGIDLGTTNSAIAYVDRRSGRSAKKVRELAVPQLTAPGEVQPRRQLPSFVYLTGDHELPPEATRLPFGEPRDYIVGELARTQGGRVPGRLVASSKSWLCHDRVERRAAILPWNGAPDGPRISPVEAGSRVLAHLRDAWDAEVAAGDPAKAFVAQDVVLCVPASFDAVARRLTLDAANGMGLARPVLLEEPQAALYAWISVNEGRLAGIAPPGSTILVVDVGGGTTDFALVSVRDEMAFERTAVSDHLLLGGDNMDLALARFIEPYIKQDGGELDARDWNALRYACRQAKETLLSVDGPTQATVTLLGSGTKLVGGARSTELSREACLMLALEGFFPEVELEDTTPKRSRTGLQEIGLPFVADPAITRHMGAFLRRHAPEGAALAAPTHILFNGGVVTNRLVRDRILDQLARWTGTRPVELEAESYDLAVAKGAAYYGLVRRDRGMRIQGGLGRAYYVGVDTGAKEPTPVCLTPRGLEAEKPVSVKLGMTLQANVPVQFPFYFSSSRQDEPGALAVDGRVATDTEEGDLEELPPLLTVLRSGTKRTSERKEIPVELEAKLSELGVLEIVCHATDGTDRRWSLELSVRKAGEETRRRTRGSVPGATPGAGSDTTADAGTGAGVDAGREGEPVEDEGALPDPVKMARAKELIAGAFGPDGDAHGPLGRLGRDLEELFGQKREGWSLALCRALFEPIFEQREARRRSAEHEQRFWNLAAFCLRPGFGAVLDDHRVSQLWKLALSGLSFPKSDACRLEWWIFQRRIAGGAGKGHQEQIFHRVREDLLGKPGGGGGNKRIPRQEAAEEWRLAASLEHIPARWKEDLGGELVRLIERGEGPPRWGIWCVGRLGTRLPQYGPLNETVRGEVAGRWLGKLLPIVEKTAAEDRERAIFSVVQMGRVTGDPGRDLAPTIRAAAAELLERLGAGAAEVRPLLELVAAARPEQRLLYGDTVPAGLKLAPAAAST